MLKGINQWCFPEGTSLEHMFDVCGKAGIESVELNVSESDPVGLTMQSTAEDARAIKQSADRKGIKLTSLSTGLLGKYQLSSADEATRAQGRKVVEQQIRLASALGADTILVVPGRVNEVTSYDECYERSQRELRALLPLAEASGVCIAIENVWNKFLLSPLEFARYIDELDSPAIGAYFDVGNVLQFGYPEQWIRILGQRIRRVHVKDFRVSVGYYDGFVPLLSGDVNWTEVRSTLREIGYDNAVSAELSAYKTDPDQSIYDISSQLEVILGRKP
ncbi:sugar phosphate isomerase/epimerase family protein [Cohnella sp. GCM10027633]|uniref:sugar phosphate isomerase/epimerase family protein n=1 Tax=unclassified Cohnella TaxID=2636738 RepID=UPI00363EE115